MKRKPNPYIIALVLIDLSILAFTYFCSEVHEDGLTTFFYSGIVAGITCIILLLLRRKSVLTKKNKSPFPSEQQ